MRFVIVAFLAAKIALLCGTLASADDNGGIAQDRTTRTRSVSTEDSKNGDAELPERITRNTIYTWLYSQESLVRSMRCEYLYRSLPADPEMIQLIREWCRTRGEEEEYQKYVRSSESAEQRNRRVNFRRSGVLQRQDFFAIDGDPQNPLRIRTFDGQLVRDLSWNDGEAYASIGVPETAHWNDTNWVHPFSFLYEFLNEPYSAVVSRGKELSITRVERDGEQHIRVFLKHANYESTWFVLFFDGQGRLVERQHIRQSGEQGKPLVYEKHEFLEYERHARIWFPRRAMYHYYMGTLPDGELVEFEREAIEIKGITFNVGIPEEEFAIAFPAGAQVWDNVTPALLRGVGASLEMGLRSASVLKFPRDGEPIKLFAWVGGTSTITGKEVALNHEGLVPSDVHPVAQIEFPNKRPDLKPIRVKVKLDERC